MTKQVFIIRTAPYDYQLKGMNLYQSFNAVAKREIEVSIKPEAVDYLNSNLPGRILKSNSVYCSPRKRSLLTAHLVNKRPKVLKELTEVEFKMEDFISEIDFYDKQGNPNIQKARKAFVQALINSKLEESYDEVLQRIELFLNIILNDKSNKILVFSHGFFMKIIEAYVKDNSVKIASRNLLKYFDGCSETFKFCEGFILEFNKGKFKLNFYIRSSGGEII